MSYILKIKQMENEKKNDGEQFIVTVVKGKRKAQLIDKEIREEYTDSELANMARRMATAMKEKEQLKDQAKIASDEFKNKQNVLDSEIEELGNVINQGFQYVTVTCSLVKNFDTGKREYSHKGKIVLEEDLTAKDHQLDIEDSEKANKEEAERIAKEEAIARTEALNKEAQIQAEEAANLNEEQLKQFNNFVQSGDDNYKLKNYKDAHSWYVAAATFKPNDKALMNKILKAQNWISKQNS